MTVCGARERSAVKFERLEAASSDLRLSNSAVQRVLPLGAAMWVPADCHEAAVGYGDRRWPEWRLYEVLRS